MNIIKEKEKLSKEPLEKVEDEDEQVSPQEIQDNIIDKAIRSGFTKTNQDFFGYLEREVKKKRANLFSFFFFSSSSSLNLILIIGIN
mgnify:CR=1 FL=1